MTWGDTGEDHVDLGYLDGICCPPGVMRSFSNTSDKKALLLSILGGREPGHVVWAKSLQPRMRTAHSAAVAPKRDE